jgi:hypothetical protein
MIKIWEILAKNRLFFNYVYIAAGTKILHTHACTVVQSNVVEAM